MFLALVAIYLMIFMTSAARASAREGYWSPIVVFGITAFYYYLSLPLELYLRGEEVFATFPAVFCMSEAARTQIALSAVLALAGFVAGHHASGMGRLIAQSQQSQSARLPRSLRFVAIGAILLLFVLYRSSFSEKLSYDDNYERRYSDPVFGYLVRLCVFSSCLCVGVLVQRRGLANKIPAALIALGVVGWGFFTSDKNPLLKAALGLSAFWIGKRSRSIKHLYLYCGAAFLAIGGLPLFSAYRGNGVVDVRQTFRNYSVQNTDARGPMISLVTVLEDDAPKLYGSSYIHALVAWVPKAIWSGRPTGLGEQFALENIPNWKPGQGLGFSLLAEAHMNFGMAGAFLQYFMIAFVLGRVWRYLYQVLAAHGAQVYWRVFLAVTYFEIVAIMHRVPSSFVFQSIIFELPIPLVAFFLMDARRRRRQVATTRRLVPARANRRPRPMLPHGTTAISQSPATSAPHASLVGP